MSEAQDSPLIVDLDTGFGHAVNLAYIVPRFKTASTAAVVIKDKPYPNDTSLNAEAHQLLMLSDRVPGHDCRRPSI
jgi:phosphoenolpyruvate phosphomutase